MTKEPIHETSAADVLLCIRESMGGDSAGYLDPVIGFARQIPAFSGNMLELYADGSRPGLDFAFRSTGAFDKPLLQDEHTRNHPSFIRRFHQLVVNESNTGFRWGIENLCFEYDAPFQDDPSVFFDLGSVTGRSAEEKVNDLQKIAGSFQYVIPAGLPVFLRQLQDHRLDTVYFGCMFSRKPASVRLTIHGVAPDRLCETLMNIGWCGNADGVARLQNDYLLPTQRIALAVDFTDRLESRIGIEVFDEQISTFIEKLRKNRMMEANQYGFLKRWPGTVVPHVSQFAALTRLHQRPATCIFKRINHIKFVIHGLSVSTKAYLYYCF